MLGGHVTSNNAHIFLYIKSSQPYPLLMLEGVRDVWVNMPFVISTERSEWRNLFNICFMTDMKARELLDRAEELRRNCRFGEAINFYRAAAAAPDATDEIKRKSLASVELMQEINGFVNTDLMNP